MKDWTHRSQINEDVVFFPYTSLEGGKSLNEVYVWDLDKTYLDTKIDSISGLFSTAVERALNKKNIPGTRTFLQMLSKSWKNKWGKLQFPIYFITASPPQMEQRIFEKFNFDGIRPVGCFYRDNLRNIHPKRFWRLTKQVGFKIQALLQLRTYLKSDVRQICWGDDSESDAIIYNLYSDICARRLSITDTRQILKSLSVPSEQIEKIFSLQTQIAEFDPVEKIYINLAVDTDPEYYLKFGRRTVPTYNTFQIALDCFQDKRLGTEEVYTVAKEMIFEYGFSPEELNRSFDEMVRRRIIGITAFQEIVDFLINKGVFSVDYKPSMTPSKELETHEGKVFRLEGHYEPWVPERIDYLHDYR